MRKAFYLILILTFFCACDETKPQSPSNRRSSSKEDSLAVELVLLNQRLVEVADRELADYVMKHETEGYVLDSTGCWYRYRYKEEDGGIVDKSTEIVLRLTINDLKGEMYYEMKGTGLLNDMGLLPIVVSTIEMMPLGSIVELLVPWYQAYGSTGDELIPPYTNLKVIIETN